MLRKNHEKHTHKQTITIDSYGQIGKLQSSIRMMRVQAIAGMEMYKHLSVERRNVFEVAAKGEATPSWFSIPIHIFEH